MRAVVQRVTEAQVEVEGKIEGSIRKGLLIFVGIETTDDLGESTYLARKVSGLRIFDDGDGRMNCSAAEVGGELLVISQFTLCADVRSGNRPSFGRAARPEVARPIYEHFVSELRNTGLPVETGIFQAHMTVRLTNDGPVTVICESARFS